MLKIPLLVDRINSPKGQFLPSLDAPRPAYAAR